VPKPRRARLVALVDLLALRRPDVDPNAVSEGRVIVDGRVITNPAALVRADSSLRVLRVRRLRGNVKLSHAIDRLGIAVAGRIAVDVGASAGGFTTALLDHGASRVYAVDVGVGQLVGRLRSDPRVVNLEGLNLAALDSTVIPDLVDVITMDLSYLSVADAVPQLEHLNIDQHADLVALVKPTFELHRSTVAASDLDLTRAVNRAAQGIARSRWSAVASCAAPVPGRRGAYEAFIHARRTPT
jgi:23S rRNA (cytidine1920-2'-O)/16S rRNA (cytidine1409-2'-O)-methyltransferase